MQLPSRKSCMIETSCVTVITAEVDKGQGMEKNDSAHR